MNDKALKTLEYDKIISRLETYASSPMGKKPPSFPPRIMRRSCSGRRRRGTH